jgi:Lhr-like helicase
MVGRGWSPFEFQYATWSAYLAGRSGLVNAPTGMGKTLAVWLGPICEWLNNKDPAMHADTGPVKRPGKPAESEPISVLWITSLRALASDTVSSLLQPVQDIALPWSVELRTGDTSADNKRRQTKRYPSALVTTPESLSLLLTNADTREKMSTLKCIIVDEWHELLGSKRGVQTELALARLRSWFPALRTWGLSATLSNPQSAMATLLGPDASGELVFGQTPKEVTITTLVPKTMDRFPWSGHIGRLGVDDLLNCLNAAELARRQFREIARVSGLIFSGFPGAQKAARQIQASSGLLYDVFSENDPDNLLLDQARREVLQGQLELSRLHDSLMRMGSLEIVEVTTERLTPFAFPIWAERIQAIVSTETFSDRVKKMVLQLEAAAAK